MNEITWEQAQAGVEAAVAKSRELGLKMNVARENLGRLVILLPSLKAPTPKPSAPSSTK